MNQKTLKNILVTRPLTEEQLEYARRLGLNPLVVPALRVEFPSAWNKVMRKLDQYPGALWVFTSQNGVEALGKLQGERYKEQSAGRRVQGAGYREKGARGREQNAVNRLREIPDIYAVGEKTAEALEELGIDAQFPEQQDALGLAKLITDRVNKVRYNKTESLQSKSPGSAAPHAGQASKPVILHWCGNRRRDELGRELKEAGFEYIDLEVYQTELNAITLPGEKPDAILFFSPSAVEAFRLNNGFKGTLPELFAIGNTTGEALSLESGQNVHIPAVPSTEALLELVAGILSNK
jgi:uroporphyrinogen-III synthase